MVGTFSVYMIFFDTNNYNNRRELLTEIEQLESQVEYYRKAIEQDSTLLENLNDDEFLEAYAREHFLMKRSDETVIVVE